MKIDWLNGNLRINPESEEERSALFVLSTPFLGELQLVDVDHGINSGPSGDIDDQQTIIGVDHPL